MSFNENVCHLVAVAIFGDFEPVFVILKAEVLAHRRNDTFSRRWN